MTTMKQMMKEFEDNILEGYADFKFKQNGDSVHVKMRTQLSKEMTVAMFTDLLFSIKSEFGINEVNEIMKEVMVNLIILDGTHMKNEEDDDET